jgi:serine/threonine protein phosphatase PrpC
MSRSIGDLVAKKAGVISDPEIREHELSNDDMFCVLGTDGIWEFMTNKEVGDIVEPFYKAGNSERAAEQLVVKSY